MVYCRPLAANTWYVPLCELTALMLALPVLSVVSVLPTAFAVTVSVIVPSPAAGTVIVNVTARPTPKLGIVMLGPSVGGQATVGGAEQVTVTGLPVGPVST